jgi:hypothetical protein
MYIFILAKIPAIGYVSSAVLMLPILIGGIKIRDIKATPLMLIFIYCLLYAILEIIAWYYALHGLQNHFLENLSTYLEVILISYFYYCVIVNPTRKRIILILTSLALGLVLWSHFGTGRNFNVIDSYARSIGNITLIASALIFFFQLFNTLEVKNLFTYSYFWIGIAVLIYFSGIFFVNIFAEYITFNNDKAIQDYWFIKEYLTIFHRIFLAIGLWFSTTPQQSSPSSK